jgi:hypothetical protein
MAVSGSITTVNVSPEETVIPPSSAVPETTFNVVAVEDIPVVSVVC